jgi:hypothetical protein
MRPGEYYFCLENREGKVLEVLMMAIAYSSACHFLYQNSTALDLFCAISTVLPPPPLPPTHTVCGNLAEIGMSEDSKPRVTAGEYWMGSAPRSALRFTGCVVLCNLAHLPQLGQWCFCHN